jgi:hypothetical protein
MNGKYFNKMPFDVSLRKTWLPEAPSAKLKPGEQVEGPMDLLSKYYFLSPVPFDFHKVDSITQAPNFEYTDKITEHAQQAPTEPVIVTPPFDFKGVEERPPTFTNAVYHQPIPKEPVIEQVAIDMSLLPFNPKADGFSWMSVKTEDLHKTMAILNIDMSVINQKPLKDQKWDMIALIKRALGIGK